MKILLTGGGTGGHIYPIVAVVREIKKIPFKEPLEFYYIGPRDDFSLKALTNEGVKFKIVLSGKIRRYFGIRSFFENIIDIFIKVPIGIFQAFWYIFFLVPDITFSKGGYGSLPAVLSCWVLRTPIFLHESDGVVGLANRFLAKFTLEIFSAFPIKSIEGLPAKKIMCIGNPVRVNFLKYKKEEAQKIFNLTGEKPVIFILGGSQGAQRINDKVLEILPEFLESFELIHQTGVKNFKQVKSEVKIIMPKELEKYYHPVSFLDEKDLMNAYMASDLVVSRAGSSAIFEIAAAGKPSILIPLAEAAQNHQIKNAYKFAETEATVVIEEVAFKAHYFLTKIKYLFDDPEQLKNMSERAKEFSKPKAGNILAEYILEYLKKISK